MEICAEWCLKAVGDKERLKDPEFSAFVLALAHRLGAEKASTVLHTLIQNLESVNDDGTLASFLLLNLTVAEPLDKAVEGLAEVRKCEERSYAQRRHGHTLFRSLRYF